MMHISKLSKITLLANCFLFSVCGLAGALNIHYSGLLDFKNSFFESLGALSLYLCVFAIALINLLAVFGNRLILISAFASAALFLLAAQAVIFYVMFITFGEDKYNIVHILVGCFLIFPMILNVHSFKNTLHFQLEKNHDFEL